MLKHAYMCTCICIDHVHSFTQGPTGTDTHLLLSSLEITLGVNVLKRQLMDELGDACVEQLTQLLLQRRLQHVGNRRVLVERGVDLRPSPSRVGLTPQSRDAVAVSTYSCPYLYAFERIVLEGERHPTRLVHVEDSDPVQAQRADAHTDRHDQGLVGCENAGADAP